MVADAKLAEPHAANQSFLFTALLQESPRQLALQSPLVLLKSPLPQRSVEGWLAARLPPLDETISSRSIPCSARGMPRCFANARCAWAPFTLRV